MSPEDSRARGREGEGGPEARFLSLHARYGSEAITVIGPGGSLLYESASVGEMLGYRDAGEVPPAQDRFRDVHPEDQERFRRAFEGCMVTPGESPPVEYRNRDADGGWRWLESRGVNLLDDPGVGAVVVSTREITDRKRAEEALAESEERFRVAFEEAAVGVALVGTDGRILRANGALRGMFGYPEAELLTMTSYDLTHPDDHAKSEEWMARRGREGPPGGTAELRFVRRDGAVLWSLVSASLVRDASGEPAHWVCHYQDITGRERAERDLRESEARFRQLFEQSVDAVVVHDAEGRIVDVNQKVCRSLGYTREELLSMRIGDYETKLLSPQERAERERSGGTLWQRIVAHEPGTVSGTHAGENRRKDGTTFPVEVRVGGVDYGGERMVLSSIRDVTERRALEERLRHQALHDPLTGLPGRELLTDRLREALARAGRGGGRVAVLFVDVDNLKLVNDSLGHEAGDRLLRAAGERLRGCVREGDTVSRFGGDEFVILLGEPGAGEAPRVAGRVLRELEKPLRLDEREVPLSASVGLAMGPVPKETRGEGPEEDAEDGAGDLIRHADAAMYRAKSAGGGGYAVFDPEMDRTDLERLELSADLRGAVERGEMRVFYQHKVDLTTGGVTGWEALLRWEHPERGTISPDTFIPIAEETGLIIPLGKWVIEQACEQARLWRGRHPKEPGQFMSVNLSPKQFSDPDLGDSIERALRRSGLPAGALDLEITEGVLVEDEVSDFARIRELKGMGVTFSLDDFGTGYSSLLSLKQLPVDSIKVDRAFVERVPGTPADEAFVVAMVGLARALGLAVVAEGIERGEQWRRLRELGCDYGQGFHFAPPLPAEEASRRMRRLEGARGEAGDA